MIRLLSTPAVLLAATLTAASPAIALTMATSQGTAICAAHSQPSNFSFGPTTAAIVQLGCDRTGTDGTGPFSSTVQSVVVINTGHSTKPIADVQLSLIALRGLGGPVAGNQAFGQAQVDYQADIRLIQTGQPAPFNPGRIPVIASALWSIERTGAPGASVAVSVVQRRTPTTTEEGGGDGRILGDGLNSAPRQEIGGTFRIVFDAWLNVPIDVQIEAICNARKRGVTGAPRDCQAVIDPLFRFDQAAFDATWGANSFVLADFYGFGLSANLPEPGQTTLLGLGLLGLALLVTSRPGSRKWLSRKGIGAFAPPD